MKTITLQAPRVKEQKTSNLNDIEQFYNEATTDYKFWSKNYNMHFGYCQLRRTLPFLRESMLTEMNRQVMLRLSLPKTEAQVTDLGCGMGGTMRYLLQNHSLLKATGVTISKFQVEQGNILLSNLNGNILQENFCNTSLSTESQDGVVAIESLCHAGHNQKALKEAYRMLKKGGRFVIADAFRKREQLSPTANLVYKKICKNWCLTSIGEINAVKQQLKKIGFKRVKVEDVSWRVAPSVFHAPITTLQFIICKRIRGQSIKKESWENMYGSLLGLIMGLHRNDFAYYIITAEK